MTKENKQDVTCIYSMNSTFDAYVRGAHQPLRRTDAVYTVPETPIHPVYIPVKTAEFDTDHAIGTAEPVTDIHDPYKNIIRKDYVTSKYINIKHMPPKK